MAPGKALPLQGIKAFEACLIVGISCLFHSITTRSKKYLAALELRAHGIGHRAWLPIVWYIILLK